MAIITEKQTPPYSQYHARGGVLEAKTVMAAWYAAHLPQGPKDRPIEIDANLIGRAFGLNGGPEDNKVKLLFYHLRQSPKKDVGILSDQAVFVEALKLAGWHSPSQQ